MNKTRLLIKNSLIIGIGTLSTKVLSFLLLPLYTHLLNPDDYGYIDVLITLSSLILPLAALEINSGVFRFIIGSETNHDYSKTEIISTGIAIEFAGLSLTCLVAVLINLFFTIPNFELFIIYVVSLAVTKLLLDSARGFGDNTTYSIANIIISFISLCLNVVLIAYFHKGASAILLSAVIGNIAGSVFVVVRNKIWDYFSFNSISVHIGKQMLKYTAPLIPNTISWWIASASDRVIILFFLGSSANGIYAVANKIPGIYTTIFSVFSLAWTEAVSRYSDDSAFVKKTINNSIAIMSYLVMVIIIITSVLFELLIGNDYSDSYIQILILMCAVFFSSLSSLYGGIFSGKMNSSIVASTTIIGAIINIVINLLFINHFGLYAASISTLISYLIISILRNNRIKQWYNIDYANKEFWYIIPLFILTVISYLLASKVFCIVTLFFIIIVFYFNHKKIFQLIIDRFRIKQV